MQVDPKSVALQLLKEAKEFSRKMDEEVELFLETGDLDHAERASELGEKSLSLIKAAEALLKRKARIRVIVENE